MASVAAQGQRKERKLGLPDSPSLKQRKPAPLTVTPRMARTIPLGGYQHSFEREAAELIPDIFLLEDAPDLTKVASYATSSAIDLPSELASLRGSEPELKCKAWMTLIASALGFGKDDTKDQVERSTAFCTALLDHFPALILALRTAYESHRTKPSSHSLLELRRALSLLGIVLVVLRENPNLPSVLRKSRACATSEHNVAEEEKQKKSQSEADGPPVAAASAKAKAGESLPGLLARMLAEGGEAQERAGWYRLPLKVLLQVFNAVLLSLSPKTADAGGADALARRTGRECGEWELRDLAAQITSTHCPVIVTEVKGALKCTTFRTVTPASQEALNIMEAAVAKGASARAKDAGAGGGESPITSAEWFCREAYHHLEGCVDAAVTAYLGVFAPPGHSPFFPLTPRKTKEEDKDCQGVAEVRHKLIVTDVATRWLLRLLSLLRRGGQRDAATCVLAMAQRRNVLLILIRLLQTSHRPSTLTTPRPTPPALKTLKGALGSWGKGVAAEVKGVWPRGVQVSLGLLKLLQKLTKRSHLHLRTVVKVKGLEVFEEFLAVQEPSISCYALKLLKSCYRHAGQQWRERRIDLVTRIYLELRMDLVDNWCTPVEFDGPSREKKRKEDTWRTTQLEALHRRREAARAIVEKRFPPPKKPETAPPKLDPQAILRKLFKEVTLPEDFEDNWDAWLASYRNV